MSLEIRKMTPNQFQKIRKRAGLTQTELGKALNYKRQQIHRFEHGKVKISPALAVYMLVLNAAAIKMGIKGGG